MLPKDIHDFFKIINTKFNTCITANNEIFDSKIDEFSKVENFNRLLKLTNDKLSVAFVEQNTLETKDREVLSAYLIWFVNQLVYISINDSPRRFEQHVIELQKAILQKSHRAHRWCFFRLIFAHTSLLKQGNNWNDDAPSIDLKIPFMPSAETLSEVPVPLNFPELVIRNEEQLDNLVHSCISLLTFTVPQYCNMKPSQGNETRDVMLEIFRHRSLPIKTSATHFFAKYLNLVATFTNEDTQFFIAIVHAMSIVYKDIPFYTHGGQELKNFQDATVSFFTKAPVDRMNFDNLQHVQQLITNASEILFHQMMNCDSFWFKTELIKPISNVMKSALDNTDCAIDAIGSLRQLLNFDSEPIVSLMKFLVIAELESTSNFHPNVIESSPSWRIIHGKLMKRLEDLPQVKCDHQFQFQLDCILDFFLLAVNIEFMFTQRHQLRHGMFPDICPCSSIEDLKATDEPLMKFRDWDYKHIGLTFVEDLEVVAQKILTTLEQRAVPDAPMVACTIDIFSNVLKLSAKSQMSDEIKQTLLAVVASPFYKSLKLHDKFSKSAGFLKVLSLLPAKFKSFFDGYKDERIEHMKSESIAQLTQLPISGINIHCWWLASNIVQYITQQPSEQLNEAMFTNFKNLIVNNGDQLKGCIEMYAGFFATSSGSCDLMATMSDVLCLTSHRPTILKLLTDERAFNHFVICRICELSRIVYPKDDPRSWMAFAKDTNGLLVSPDRFQAELNLKLDFGGWMKQPNNLKMELMGKLPALMNHSKEFKKWMAMDRGKALFQGIFVKDASVLQHLEAHLKDLIRNIQKCFDGEERMEMLRNCFQQLTEIAKFTAYGTDAKLQEATVNLTFIYATNVVDENIMVKSFKILLLYIVQNNSQVIGEAAHLALEMAKRNDTTLYKLFNWHKTFIMRHVIQLAVTNFLASKTPLVNSLYKMIKRLNFPGLHDFILPTLDTIIAVVLPMSVISRKLMDNLNALCSNVSVSLADAIKENILKIYQNIYTTQTGDIRDKCLKFIETTTDCSIRKLLTAQRKKIAEEVLVYYNKSPDFVMDVMRKLLNNERSLYQTDEIAEDISNRFLGVLIYFEPFLTSMDCERVVKKDILLSLGDIIRLLGTDRISSYCFKIIPVLKVATEQTTMDLSETCIQVWKILILNCDVTSLGPMLGTIFVSLEVFVEKYAKEVDDIYRYLVVDNASLLSRYIASLFFIEKMTVGDDIKRIVMRQIDSQKGREEPDFKGKMNSLIGHLKNENDDLKIRVFCFQYLTELFRDHRAELNELICGQVTMDPMVEELLRILANNCKSIKSESLQLAMAECIGELGAIEPSLQQQNYASQMEFPGSIHSDEFAKLALAQLCRSYQYRNDAKHIDSLSLAIQQILRSRNVTVETRFGSDVWEAIPMNMRTQMERLLTSSYLPKLTENFNEQIVFWNQEQTATDWMMRWAGSLISRIHNEDTKGLLRCLKPSMKHNQYTTSLFLPYILLHSLETADPSTHRYVKDEVQFVFNIVMGKVCFEQGKMKEPEPLFVRCFDFRPIALKKKLPENDMKSVAMKVAKLIFEAFDFLEQHCRKQKGDNEFLRTIRQLLDAFDLEEMAKVNYECGEYARAMIYLEAKLKKAPVEEFQSKLSFLANIFAKLGSRDAVEGVQTLKTEEWSLAEKVLISNVTDNYQDCATCFERMMTDGNVRIEHVEGMVKSYIALNQPETALQLYENLARKSDDKLKHQLSDDIKAEPLWRLSRFDELEQLLDDKTVQQSTNWGVRCGQLLLIFRESGSYEKFAEGSFADELRNTRLALMKNLKISGNERTANFKNYRDVVNLHLATEFEQAKWALTEVECAADPAEAEKAFKELISDWDGRMEFIQKNAAIEEPILCFRRIVLEEMSARLPHIVAKPVQMLISSCIDDRIGKLWIQSAQLARRNKMLQQAQVYILNAEAIGAADLFIEKAKLSWIKCDQSNALNILELGTKKLLGNKQAENLSAASKQIYSMGKLLIARYNAEAVNLDFETNKTLFKEANVKGAENEKLFLHTAEYMDRYYSKENANQIARIGEPKHMREVMRAYYKSMKYGSEYVFQSMPRFLSIWLDTTSQNHKVARYKDEIKLMNKDVEAVVESLDLFHFYTAFSQLISRICHPSEETFKVLKTILVKLIRNYPQQSLWFLVPVLKSCHVKRVKRCKEVLSDDRIKDRQMQNLVMDFNSLIEKLVKLATTNFPTEHQHSMQKCAPDLAATLSRQSFILPFHCNLQLIRACKQSQFKFAETVVCIARISEKIEVMRSMQKPKKIVVIGDDGKEYAMLLKSKDDLRIDLRFIEFTSVIKEFLHKDPESRERLLTTRAYSVIPLNENCGIIEWVPNLRTYKDVIFNEYKKKSHPHLRLAEQAKSSSNSQLETYRKLKKVYYPALSDYLRQQFSTPQNFFKARLAYIKTTAAISIIGYIMGLGDRHGENILFDVCSGETVHVDFNMLFNRGEDLQVPEVVPFRLTQNMIDAMGVLGSEGPFKKSCEIMLRVMQKEKSTLLSYLRPMVYDPLLKSNDEWSNEKKSEVERVETVAIKRIKDIENRLKGIASKYKGTSGIPLSTEGHVNFIIGEAKKEENLAVMFHGWMPWM